MHVSPTLTAEEFKDLHNAKCELHGIMQTMDGVVHPSLQTRFEKALAKINAALKHAYELDDAVIEAKSEHYNAVAAEHRFDTIWSMDEVSDLNAKHPYAGATHVHYSQHWGQATVLVPIEGDTWVDLWKAAEKAIQESSDNHHIFIENFKPFDNQPEFLNLSTGS